MKEKYGVNSIQVHLRLWGYGQWWMVGNLFKEKQYQDIFSMDGWIIHSKDLWYRMSPNAQTFLMN